MTGKAYGKLWSIIRLKKHGASNEDLTDVYIKQVRSILEYSVPVWNSALTNEEKDDIERVQKCFLHITLGAEYGTYETALLSTGLENLEIRRTQLCLNFAKKAAKHPTHKQWFEPSNQVGPNTRCEKLRYKQPICRLERFRSSPIPYFTELLNSN